MSNWQQRQQQRQQVLREAGLWRDRPLLTSAPGREVQVNGVWRLNFASNDYLGLASDNALVDEARVLHGEAGWAGSTASHALAGHHMPHHLLEDELADWLSVERAIVFSSGYLANLAVQTALLETGDLLLHDKLNHASLIDGAHLSSATFKRYPHNDMAALARRLAQANDGLKMVVSDAVFSMDGDWVDLAAMQALCHDHDALLIVDEAHSFGVLGEAGRGLFAHQSVRATESVLRVGTLGKAFASSGAFIAGSQLLIDSVMQFGRAYRYTTAQPPYQASFTRAALRRVIAGASLREHLSRLIDYFRLGAQALGLTLLESHTPIQPVLLGDSDRALRWQGWLDAAGLWVPAIRTPTVPSGSARLRISIMASHQLSDIDRLIEGLMFCQQQEQRLC